MNSGERRSLNVKNETSRLRAVVVGTGHHMGPVPTLEEAYDPKSRQHIEAGTYPLEPDLVYELQGLVDVLERHGVEVLRPEIVENCNQVFSRDIGFVIDNTFVIPHVLPNRKHEFEGIQYVVDQMNPEHVLEVSNEARIEGGDVMPWNDKIFVGYSREPDFSEYVVARTNNAGVDFLKTAFPNREVIGFELKKSDTDPRENALHLDCCFQPIGTNQAIIYRGGFKKSEEYDWIVNYFGSDNLIEITKEEMYEMNSNIFSVSPEVIVSDVRFKRLNKILRERGFVVEEIPFGEVAKMEGLFRCTTLPLLRD